MFPGASLLVPRDADSQEVEALVDVDDLCLLLGQAKAHRSEDRCDLFAQALGVGAGAVDHDHKGVRVADEAVGRESLAPSPMASAGVAHRLPRVGEVFVECGQGDVGE